MRILIDECLNWRLADALSGHYAVSVQKMGWSGVTNGKLLSLAVQEDFDIFLTADRNLSFQQNIERLKLGVIILACRGVQLEHTLPLIPKVLEILPRMKPGMVATVSE